MRGEGKWAEGPKKHMRINIDIQERLEREREERRGEERERERVITESFLV